MTERVATSSYQRLHHFISESSCDHRPIIAQVGKDISNLFSASSRPVGLIIDESGHLKSGKRSVGVARQYLGSIGKVDNGQVGVFCALSQQDKVALIDGRLYLPSCWTDDKRRCKKAGVPLEDQVYKTKPELALEMVKNLPEQVAYDWIGGDSLYGNSTALRKGLQRLGKLFVFDVGEDLKVYLQDPKPYIPTSKSGRGRKKSSYVSDNESLKVKDLLTQASEQDWQTYTFRVGTNAIKLSTLLADFSMVALLIAMTFDGYLSHSLPF